MAPAVKRCACCGQIIPPADHPFRNAEVKRRIYDAISKHPEGLNRRQVIEMVYGDDPNGGPEEMNVISVHVQKMNERLLDKGVKIASSGGPYSVYRLVAL